MKADTIAAIATSVVPQQGSVGIVRLSGPEAIAIARKIFHAPGKQAWESHRILYGSVRDPETGETIDEALLLLMLAPRSYTREDIAELHCHGGIVPVQRTLRLCIAAGARLAEPGEFTLRAFLNGRIDLTQAESIAELVGAQSQQAAQIALAGLQGKLAQPLKQLRETCLDILAEVEARIDFADDLPPLDEAEIRDRLQTVSDRLDAILATAERGELLRNGLKVAIVGRPNVGKSSLLNAWSRSDRAIVTDLPGTTRDIVESHLVVGGMPVQVLDTAGIRATEDVVEQIGVTRSQQAAQQADLVLLVIDAATGWTPEDGEIYARVRDRPLLLVINKTDLTGETTVEYPAAIARVVHTAAAHQQGIEALEREILNFACAGDLQAAGLDIAINQRQEAALTHARTSLQQVQETAAQQLPLDFWSIDLRGAIQALGEVLGEEVTEAVLDRIFSKFCIGK